MRQGWAGRVRGRGCTLGACGRVPSLNHKTVAMVLFTPPRSGREMKACEEATIYMHTKPLVSQAPQYLLHVFCTALTLPLNDQSTTLHPSGLQQGLEAMGFNPRSPTPGLEPQAFNPMTTIQSFNPP